MSQQYTGITPRMRDLVAFVSAFQSANGWSPSYAEMTNALGLHSKSGISRLIDELESRGVIRRRKNLARSIEIVSPATVRVARLAAWLEAHMPALREQLTDAVLREMLYVAEGKDL